jgi:hypothetical protein
MKEKNTDNIFAHLTSVYDFNCYNDLKTFYNSLLSNFNSIEGIALISDTRDMWDFYELINNVLYEKK